MERSRLPALRSNTSTVLLPSAATNSRCPLTSIAKWSNRPFTSGIGIVLMSFSETESSARTAIAARQQRANQNALLIASFNCLDAFMVLLNFSCATACGCGLSLAGVSAKTTQHPGCLDAPLLDFAEAEFRGSQALHEPSRLRVADPRSGPRLCEAQRFMVPMRAQKRMEALHEPAAGPSPVPRGARKGTGAAGG